MSSSTAVATACPACDSKDVTILETHHDAVASKDYVMLRCAGCELVFSQPFEFPGRDWYEKFNYIEGYGEFGGGGSEDRFTLLLDKLPISSGRILDIGCAAGTFLKHARAKGLEPEGLEVDRRFMALARQAGFGAIHEGILDDRFAAEHAGRYDAVALLDVLEHLDELPRAMERIRKLLKPRGYFLISVPDNRRPTPFGRDLWDYPPHHLSRWTPKALTTMLERNGFELLSLQASRMPTWEFSRFWADRSAAWLLRLIKRLMFGTSASSRPMADLLQDKSAAGAAAVLPGKGIRVRLVSLYHFLFFTASYPFFFAMKLYYKATLPGVGVNLLVVARKAA